MSRLIDANKCFDAIVKWAADEECTPIAQGACKAAEIIASCPTVDAVEVMRCKDCIFWGDEDGIQYIERIKKRCARCRAHNYEFNGQHWGWCPTEDDYCSFGERKEVSE